MAYIVEADVNLYGTLVGGDDFLPLPTAFHQWCEPYPAIPEPIQVSWLPGDLSVKPNILVHNLLQDFAVDELALDVLTSAVDSSSGCMPGWFWTACAFPSYRQPLSWM